MPTLNVDQFDTPPKVGDKVKVIGKVKTIDDNTGEVDVSYDSVTIVKKSKSSDNSNDNADNTDNMNPGDTMPPNSQSLDQALAQSFPASQ